MKQLSIVIAAAACLASAACSNQYIERKDSVTLGAGDAVASNIAVMTHDPWPRESRNNQIPMDGVKAATALARYRSNSAAGNGLPPVGLGAAPPAAVH